MNKKLMTIFLFLGIYTSAQTGGGMWIPNELNEKDMKAMGMRIDAKDIFNPKKASIKDAIVHFNGGCTSELISPKGLLLTNHHCGYSQIQSHSSVDNDYLKDGFWAKSFQDELPNSGLTATFIIDIKDVSDKVLNGVTPDMTEEKRMEWVKDNSEIVIKNIVKEAWQDAEIKPFYKGNKYYLFITETYKDVRLVGAPPSSIGKFGSDTDNWVWPRHTGDFSIFRIYADKNNRPAAYSKENVPYTPKHYLPINIGGIDEDDFTFVFGFPGRTNEYLPAVAIEQTVTKLNPAKIKLRDESLKIIDKYMREDDEIRIQYASKYARVANYWKKWIGENQGIQKSGAIAIKKKYEKAFQDTINQICMLEKSRRCVDYPSILPQLEDLYTEIAPYKFASSYFDEAIYRNSESFRMALLFNNILNNSGENSDAYYGRVKNYISSLYKNFNPKVDEEVSLKLWSMYKKDMPQQFQDEYTNITAEDFQNSIISGNVSVNGFSMTQNSKKAFENKELLLAALQKDPLVQKIGRVVNSYEHTVTKKQEQLQRQIDNKLRTYMKAQLELMNADGKAFPDANSTLRVTYGKVKGYEPRDAVAYDYQTTLKGVMEKYVPGDYEFDVPMKLQNLYAAKNYGKYGENGEMPVNFIATNHTTGGNSGSPALDAEGNLIGLNFDRVWEGTMSDLYYDPEICRNIMVDARYILFVIDKYANAGRLIDEMKLVK